MEKFRVVLDGAELRYQREWTPLVRRVVRGIARRRRGKWRPLVASGILGAVNSGAFQATVVIHTSGSGATETFLQNASNVELQAWAAGGLPGTGAGSGCTARQGGGGGAGAYTRCSFNIAASPLKTLTYTVGSSGGNNTTVTSGTFTISAITCNTGTAGGTATAGGANGTGSAGGSATNANSGAVNTTGASGSAGQTNGSGGQGGAGTAGNVTGDGSPYGQGGKGGLGASQTGQTAAQTGAVVLFYT